MVLKSTGTLSDSVLGFRNGSIKGCARGTADEGYN